jgi:hypothetical protein
MDCSNSPPSKLKLTYRSQFMSEHIIPLCAQCGTNQSEKAYSLARTPHLPHYKRICTSCRRNPYAVHKKDSCERCGFVPEWRGQLDVDHIDGNHDNNELDNLQTLCANCHRFKTHLCKDRAEYTNIEEEVHPQLSLVL